MASRYYLKDSCEPAGTRIATCYQVAQAYPLAAYCGPIPMISFCGGPMRNKRFVAEHRGGPLRRAQHDQLMEWACGCADHVLFLLGRNVDGRLRNALRVAKEWKGKKATGGEARKASLDAIAVARESTSKTAIAVARSIGHAVATAHMADHSLGAAWYALKAVENAGRSAEKERTWQDDKLPEEIRELVIEARATRRI